MTLPEILTRYFDAANRFDSAAVADCFTANAVVHDEQHDHVGLAAIRAWAEETGRKYQPISEVIRAEVGPAKCLLSVRVSGSFPGSPIELDYDITLSAGKISQFIVQ